MQIESMQIERMQIEPLDPGYERAGFRCGIPSFDKYFHAQARRDKTKNLAAVFVGVLPGGKIAGFYTLSAATLLLPDLLGAGRRPVSRYPPLRAARLTRLAVDKRHRGQGLARALLDDAFQRLRNSAGKPLAMIADAQNEAALRFLTHSGFQSFADHPNRAFRMMDVA